MLHIKQEFETIVSCCNNSNVGKHLPLALYVHHTALEALDPILQEYEQKARLICQQKNKQKETATLIKFNTQLPKISYLYYPEFDTNPHPAIKSSIVVNMETQETNFRDYSKSENPPILHRKETFITNNYPLYETFAKLTAHEEALGLLDNVSQIGTQQQWFELLKKYRVGFQEHFLICPLDYKPANLTIERHKAAIVRSKLSRPVNLAIEANLFTEKTTFFDYGCGYGGDVERIAEKGFQSSGWDPFYLPNNPLKSADIVNVGYVINVIENIQERQEALIKAWELTKEILLVSAQILIDDYHRGLIAYGDGIITCRNTFQKYYQQEELKYYIDRVLNVNSIPVDLGIYFVFRDEDKAETFRASRFHSQANTPRIRVSLPRFEDCQQLLTPLMNFVTVRGRLPVKNELVNEAEIKQEFGTFRRAFEVILNATDEKEWEAIVEKRRDEFLLYLALSQFTNRPKYRKLSHKIREDIKALFGSYKRACMFADLMLLSLQDLDNIAELCRKFPVGIKFKNALLVHINVLETLPSILRLYEGCASRTFGRLQDANLIKFYFKQPKIEYLYYPDFDNLAHPILANIMSVDLQDLHVRYIDYQDDRNPPILHRKDAVVNSDYPLYQKFAKLTSKEKNWGLLDNFSLISRRQGWLKLLEERCVTIKGHSLYWRKDASPDRIKLLRYQIKERKRKQT